MSIGAGSQSAAVNLANLAEKADDSEQTTQAKGMLQISPR